MPFNVCKGRGGEIRQPLHAFFYTGDSRPLTKGRDIVNIFRDRNMYLGEVNSKSLGTDFVELIELTRSIRNKLGCRKYMVDWYVLTLLEIANTFSISDLVGDGTDAGDRLYTLIIQSMCCGQAFL